MKLDFRKQMIVTLLAMAAIQGVTLSWWKTWLCGLVVLVVLGVVRAWRRESAMHRAVERAEHAAVVQGLLERCQKTSGAHVGRAAAVTEEEH